MLSCPPREPVNHRPSAAACSPAPETVTCATDADCPTNESVVGTCKGGLCDYDACATDTDCGPSGEVCSCGGQSYSGVVTTGIGVLAETANVCVGGNCRVDADCGPGFFCSPSFSTGCPRAITGYYCHTCEDGCIDDSDCPPGYNEEAEATFLCTFEPTNGGWVCQLGGCGG